MLKKAKPTARNPRIPELVSLLQSDDLPRPGPLPQGEGERISVAGETKALGKAAARRNGDPLPGERAG